MTKCSATCKDGGACHHNAKPGHTVCGKHMTQDTPLPPAPKVKRCRERMTNGLRCTNNCPVGGLYCSRHIAVRARRERTRLFREMWNDLWETLWTHNNPVAAQQLLTTRLTALEATFEEVNRETLRFEDELDFYEHAHPIRNRARTPPKGDLEAFTRDSQNVHTAVTVKQTNEALDLLLNTPVVSDGVSPLAHIHWRWCDWPKRGPGDFKAVLGDMTRWYEMKTCRENGDRLYKRALDGLWMRIKDSPMKDELLKRLWEEANDSLKMCCEGHISRLCNVLVGFDEAFKPQVSAGELLQQRIAAIAGEDIAVEHKVVKAWAVFEELGIPREQRADWIEAF